MVEARLAGWVARLAGRKLLFAAEFGGEAGERGYEMPLICWVVPTCEDLGCGVCGALKQNEAREATKMRKVFMMTRAEYVSKAMEGMLYK